MTAPITVTIPMPEEWHTSGLIADLKFASVSDLKAFVAAMLDAMPDEDDEP